MPLLVVVPCLVHPAETEAPHVCSPMPPSPKQVKWVKVVNMKHELQSSYYDDPVPIISGKGRR